MPAAGLSAFKSWLIATGALVTATGNVRRRMPLRVTAKTEPLGTRCVDDADTAASVMWSSASLMTSTFMSFGETHGIVPLVQYSAFAFDGVPPPDHEPRSDNCASAQPGGSPLMPPAPHSARQAMATAGPR